MASVETNVLHNLNASTSPKGASSTLNLSEIPASISPQQYALDRLQAATQSKFNPPFLLASESNPLIRSLNPLADATISRGFIRRVDRNISDETSDYKLKFMYNPQSIQRTYIAYLDQAALDPFNAVAGSNNMAAPPGLLDFSFELFFDRQLEVATDPTHPGVSIDYKFFDLVVRGIVPDTTSSGSDSAISDNGIMLLNPKDIAVVFGEDLAVYGRPYNAAIRFEKFSNRMVPVRMTIAITMKAFYIGTVNNIPNYSQYTSEQTYASTIPYDKSISYQPTFTDVKTATLDTAVSAITNPYTTNNGPVTYYGATGVKPADIPSGPFTPRIVREGSTSIGSPVTPVQLTDYQIYELLSAAGCDLNGMPFLWALAKRESSFVSNVVGHNSNGTYDAGLWQLNEINWGTHTMAEICDPWLNVNITMQKSNYGKDFRPWNRPIPPSTAANYQLNDGSYLLGVNMDEAYAFFRSLNFTGGN